LAEDLVAEAFARAWTPRCSPPCGSFRPVSERSSPPHLLLDLDTATTADVLVAIIGSGGSPSPAGPGTPQLVAFTVQSGPNGSSTLIQRKGAQFRLDPDALRQALAQHGIPAVVNVGKMCDTHPEPDGLDQVISSHRLAEGSVITTFNPAAMPAGSQISIGYFPTFTGFALIEAGAALQCSANPGSQPAGSGAGPHAQLVPGGQNTNP
jgi:hypothetical protein